ncbi:hypothetical protein [Glycomyces sp. NPDC048151]|uniref:hypothetical protein n=1 Tax=Glycomyces sp. NPDC048151 TaxID=3364002 RepID=UPI00371DDC9E
MPKPPHEVFHHLFRDDPDLARRGLKRCLGEDFPVFRSVSVINSDVSEIKAINREVDTALKIETDQGPEILIIEPQSKPPTQAKKRAWHWYLSYLEAYYDCPAALVILTASKATAVNCRKPMTLGPDRRPSATVHPLVIGPDNTPLITDPAAAVEDVMYAVLSALANRYDPEISTALDALAEALEKTDGESSKFFAQYVEAGLGKGGAHDHWKGIIMSMTYQFSSDLQKELEARGLEKGLAEGRAEGRAESLLRILIGRKVALSTEQVEQIESCTDVRQLEIWIDRAITAETAADVFDA